MLKLHGMPAWRGCGCGMPHLALQASVLPFSLSPEEAIGFLRKKLDMPTATWADLWEAEHSLAFTIAGTTTEDIVADFHEAVLSAIENGETIESFRKNFDRIVEKHGWSYNGSRNWRSSVIFDTNMSMAYSAGRWEQIQRVKIVRPYLRYVHLEGQKNPRPLHESWHNTVLPVDHPWWQTHYPPNGWFCHCTVESLNERDLERYGLSVSEDAPPTRMVSAIVGGRVVMVPEGIDPGFAYRPGAMPGAE